MLDTKSLFSPYVFGSLTLPNRIVMAPMTRNQSPDNIPGENVVEYYRKRSAGGVGLIITEGTVVSDSGIAYPRVPKFYGSEALLGWQKVVNAVHAEGGVIMPQLWHAGSMRQPGSFKGDNAQIPSYGPSAIPHPAYKEKAVTPEAMTQENIDAAIFAFAAAAENAKKLGFDGVEIHGAHAYLIDQFFWQATNARTDRYGGETLLERTRFAVELIEAVRAAVGRDFPIVFRFSQWKQGDYHHKMAKTPEELGQFLKVLSAAGVDVFHCSQRRYDEAAFEGSELNLAGWVKTLTGKPAITVGSVGIDNDFIKSFIGVESASSDIDRLIQRMDQDEFDLVAVGRALIADAEWPHKVQAGQLDKTQLFHPDMLRSLE